jgi:hypothetical protein
MAEVDNQGPKKPSSQGFFQEIQNRWDTLTTSQKAYAGAMSLLKSVASNNY